MARVVYLADDPDWLGPAMRATASGRSYAYLGRDASADAIAAALADAEALIARPGDVHVMQPACPNLRFVQFTTCDYDQAVLTDLQARGVAVSGLGAALAGEIAKVAAGLMLAVLSGARTRVDPAGEAWPRLLADLRGKAVGIVGLGRVGIEVTKLLRTTGAHLVYSDVRTPAQGLTRELGVRRSTQDRLLVESDVVTIHVPLTEQSKSALGRREFGLLRSDTALVNTSAPEVIDRTVLLSVLKAGRIRGFGTTDLDPGLASYPNVVMADPKSIRTPEVAARVAGWIAENVEQALGGEKPRGSVETIGFPKSGDPAFWSSRIAPRVEGN